MGERGSARVARLAIGRVAGVGLLVAFAWMLSGCVDTSGADADATYAVQRATARARGSHAVAAAHAGGVSHRAAAGFAHGPSNRDIRTHANPDSHRATNRDGDAHSRTGARIAIG